jgi:hypothetical protein
MLFENTSSVRGVGICGERSLVSSAWMLSQGNTREECRGVQTWQGDGLGRVMADRMFIFRGIAASCKSSLLKAIIGLLRNHSLDFFKVGYGSLDLHEKSAVSKATPKVRKFTDIVTREPRWTQMARCPNPNVAWFKMINQRQTRNNSSNA